MSSTYTPTETGTYTVRVGFCQYNRGTRLVETGSDKVTEANYVGTYQFAVVEAKPEDENPSKEPEKAATEKEKSTEQSNTSVDGNSRSTSLIESEHIAGNITYQIHDGEASIRSLINKSAAKITIPATVKINGKSVPVTSVAPNAFKGMKELTTVTIGKNIKTIGKNAFNGCKKLKKITIKTTKLTKKSVGANAFKGIYKKAVIKCPKSKKAAYKKILLKKGMKKTMTFK